MGIKIKLKRIHHYIVGVIILVLIVGGYVAWQPKPAPILTEEQIARQAIIDEWYVPLEPMMIETIQLEASIANTTETRTKGLSGTPSLPEGVVKLFVFDESQEWGFWMKDMKYAIDIIWVDATGAIVHIEEKVTPASYPMSFLPNKPAKYVIETVFGFVEDYGIKVGDRVVLPEGV
jgi:uncharacterized membrane protein (UPF0127 family)